MKIVVTGFEPFLSNTENPTERLIAYLTKHPLEGVSGILLPVLYEQAFLTLAASSLYEEADAVILFGLAQTRTQIEIERIGINIMDSRGQDNAGIIKTDETISLKGKNAYFTKLPYRKILKALNEGGIQAGISNSAGTYVCNDLFYRVLEHEEQGKHHRPVGFIHVPAFSDDFRVETLYEALKIIIKMLK